MSAASQVFEVRDLGNPEHIMAVEKFEEWSRNSETMEPLSLRRIEGFDISIFGFDPDTRRPLTHVGGSLVEDGIFMIKGYVADPDSRGQGLGPASLREVVNIALTRIEGIQKFQAYVNDKAMPGFEAIGGQFIGEREAEVATGCTSIVEIAVSMVARSVACEMAYA